MCAIKINAIRQDDITPVDLANAQAEIMEDVDEDNKKMFEFTEDGHMRVHIEGDEEKPQSLAQADPPKPAAPAAKPGAKNATACNCTGNASVGKLANGTNCTCGNGSQKGEEFFPKWLRDILGVGRGGAP